MEENREKDIKKIVSEVESKQHDSNEVRFSDKADRIVAHKYIGIVLFALIMFVVFMISQTYVGPYVQGLLEEGMGIISSYVESGLDSIGTGDFLSGLVLEGIIGGFTAVLGFLPLIMVLFFLLNLLEDSGYMARVALVMDRYFKKIGLAGKSVIPMYVGTACSIPAIMSARTIKNERQRRMTVLLTPFVPCGAKLPVIALFVGVFMGASGIATVSVYLLAILVIFFAGYIIKSLTGADFTKEEDSFLILELPDYKLPSIKNAFKVMFNRAKSFIKKAATIIILMNAIVWIATNFNFQLQLVSDPSESILHFIASPVAWLLIPLGFGVWGLAAAAIAGFVAKEEVVGALAVIYSLTFIEDFEIVGNVASFGNLTAVSAFAYMAFNLFTPPCFAAIGAMNAELQSKKWTVFAVGLQFAVGYFVALIIYQVGTLIVYGTLGSAWYVALPVFVLFVAVFLYLKQLANKGQGLANIG
jgi:ferrous iron transport protein B